MLASQGRGIGLLAALGEAATAKLAECCDDAGNVLPMAVEVTAAVLTDYYTSQKAEVDSDTPTPDA